jgi:hypothetical protein
MKALNLIPIGFDGESRALGLELRIADLDEQTLSRPKHAAAHVHRACVHDHDVGVTLSRSLEPGSRRRIEAQTTRARGR